MYKRQVKYRAVLAHALALAALGLAGAAKAGTNAAGHLPVSYTHLDVYKRQLVALADDDLCQIRQLVATGGFQHILGDLGLAFLPGLHGDLTEK